MDKSGRLDPRELNVKNEQLTTLTVIADSKEIHMDDVLKDFNGQFMEYLSDPKINCCSLYCIEIEPGQSPSIYNKKLLNMGNKAMLIYDWKRFFDILDTAIENLGLEYSRRKVTYYNPSEFSGKITLHHKDKEYSYQNEYRILIAPTDNKPINLSLPGLKKISHLINTKDIERLRIKIETETNKRY